VRDRRRAVRQAALAAVGDVVCSGVLEQATRTAASVPASVVP
jgi:hypothetical protein